MRRRTVYTLLSAVLLILSTLLGCGGSSAPAPPVISVSPSTASLIAGAAQQFTASVTGTSSTAVTWSVSGCTGTSCGTIDNNGLYTAPSLIPSDTTVNVVATLQSDTTRSGSARVNQVAVQVRISESSVNANGGDSHQFTATVTGHTNTSVTWSLSTCSLGACGTLSSTGLYTAPSSVASAADVSVTVTSQADSSKYSSATVHLVPVAFSISPAGPLNVSVNATQNFTATVSGDSSNAGVVWSLDASCTPATCGTLSNVANTSVTYTAPATVPNPATVTLTATSVTDPSKSKNVAITITASIPGLQAGDYAFVFSGWKGLGGGNFGRQVTVGHFHADSSGNVTDGAKDVNDESGVSLSVSITGTYTVNSNRRGTLTLVSAQDTATYSMTLDTTGTKGNFIRLNSSGNPVSGSGYFEPQDSSAYSSAALAGSYALYLTAKPNDSVSMAAVGRFTASSSGSLSNGEMDMLAPTASYTQLTLGGTVDAPSSTTGRGTANLTLTPPPGAFSGSMQFVYYVISANKVILMQTDARGGTAPLLSGEAQRQIGSFSLATFDAPAIFELAGMHSFYQSVVVGQITPDGTGAMTGILDENFESNASLNQSFSGTYTVDSEGRSTMTLLNGSAVAYFFGPNQAYLMEQPNPGADILYGNVKPQSAGPFSPASLSTLRISEPEPVSPFAESDSGIITFDGVGSNSFEQDFTFFYSDGTYVQQSQTGSASYTLDTNGRGVISVNGLVLPFWLVSADEVTVIDTATNGVDYLPVVQHYLK
ncbi:MAG: Ig-like domain-containing protein [Acidobacteriia bacterium]|nr:Ig-like domain-containing protein [Terriglobia bacterium]